MPRAPLVGSPKTIANKERFLATFGRLGNATAACQGLQISRAQVYYWRTVDAEFKRRWVEEAEPASVDVLEGVAWQMAVVGDKRTRRHYDRNGAVVSEETEVVRYPGVLVHLLKVRDPKRHSERIVAEHLGKNGGPIALDLQGVLRLADSYTESAKE